MYVCVCQIGGVRNQTFGDILPGMTSHPKATADFVRFQGSVWYLGKIVSVIQSGQVQSRRRRGVSQGYLCMRCIGAPILNSQNGHINWIVFSFRH